MAVRFEVIKEQILIVLYDYMLTSDSDSFCFSLTSIRDALAPDISGAFVKRAIEALIQDDELERGVGDPPDEPVDSPVYALTESGIVGAETALIKKGWNIADYHPAPSADRIVLRSGDPELHAQISEKIKELAKEVRESNEAGELLGDHRDLIVDELDVAEKLTSKEGFRLQRLMAFILPALQFIASKFFGSAIGEAAKQLITLLMKIP